MPISIEAKDWALLGAGGVIGYLTSLAVAKQTERKKDLVLEVVGRTIVVERLPNCPFTVISASGEELENVYYLSTRVWNRGTDPVRGGEISTSAPISIEIEASATLLGVPQVMKPREDMEFSIAPSGPNRFTIAFDCLNHDEWVEVGFFFTGNARPIVKGSGRIFGQNAEFDITTDDSRATLGERITSLLAFLLVVSSPFALIGSLWWAHVSYNVVELVSSPEKLPHLLVAMFGLGIVVPSFAAFYFGSIWVKRRANPKGYPIREDFDPSQWASLKSFIMTAATGKRYQVSASIYDYGEIKPRTSSRPELPPE